MSDLARRRVTIEIELRVRFDGETGRLSEILEAVRESGGSLRSHLVFDLPREDGRVALLLCAEPAEAALALAKRGLDVETETVVAVETESRRGELSHLVKTLEVEGVRVGYTYATCLGDRLLVVLRTDNNPKAEDLLTDYLVLPDDSEPARPAESDDTEENR